MPEEWQNWDPNPGGTDFTGRARIVVLKSPVADHSSESLLIKALNGCLAHPKHKVQVP